MKREYAVSKEWQERAERIIDGSPDLWWIRNMGARICYMTSDEDKTIQDMTVFGECIRVRDLFKPLMPYEFLIVFYDINVRLAGMGEMEKDILTYHELLHCDFREKKDGEILWRCKRHDIEDFEVILKQYGMNWQMGGKG